MRMRSKTRRNVKRTMRNAELERRRRGMSVWRRRRRREAMRWREYDQSVLRIGRGVANDIVLDFNGVSVYHAELFLRPDTSNAGTQLLCIRDDSKNGTGVRPGPHSPDAVALNGKVPEWENLKKGAFRVLDHG